MAIKVKLLQKPITQGRKSLYLDFWPAITSPITGLSTRREFLKMYLYEKPKTSIEKQHNVEQLKLGEAICQMRENELNKPEIYSEYEKEQLRKKELAEIDFIDYFGGVAKKRVGSNRSNWMSALIYLEKFAGGRVKFANITVKFLEEFKDYLLTTQSIKSTQRKEKLSQNSAVSYFNKVKATLRQAFRDGLIETDINSRVESIKVEETRREYLTLEELNKLVQTNCGDDMFKRAALFSALTGLRFSDIEKLSWGEVEYVEEQGYFIKFQQQKTKGVETMPISDQAYNLLGKPQQGVATIFEGLQSASYHKRVLVEWLKAADITKHITFHCFRHTFATLQLFSGTDMYTVSKMLGHREIKTTQIYAHIVDEAKRKAANKIKLDI